MSVKPNDLLVYDVSSKIGMTAAIVSEKYGDSCLNMGSKRDTIVVDFWHDNRKIATVPVLVTSIKHIDDVVELLKASYQKVKFYPKRLISISV